MTAPDRLGTIAISAVPKLKVGAATVIERPWHRASCRTCHSLAAAIHIPKLLQAQYDCIFEGCCFWVKTNMVRFLSGLFLAITSFAVGTPASAWLDAGHMQIAAVAYSQLDPNVRERADALVELNPDFAGWTEGVPDEQKAETAFVHAATWADDIKRDPDYARDTVDAPTAARNIGYSDHIVHDYWHYIDVPFSTDETPVSPPVVPNALAQVELLTATLGSDASDDVKSYDLVWLLHLVGDLHQPLHATSRFSEALGDDRGGNDETIRTTGGQILKLHLFWDALLGERATPNEAIAAAREQLAADPALAAVSDPAAWVIESFAIAQNDVYTDLIGDAEGPFGLTAIYEKNAALVARQRAALAGSRLANLINSNLK